LSGRSAGQEIKIPVNKFFIGRAEDCHLRPHSDLISRHHCALLVEEGQASVRDFGSRNGTYVNDERVVGQRELHNGDKLKAGNLEFEVQLSSSVGGKKKPKVKDVKDAAVRTATGKPAGGTPDDDVNDWLAADDDDQRDTKRIDPRETAQSPHHETPASLSSSLRDTTFVKSPTVETTTLNPEKAKAAAEPAKPAEAATPPAATGSKFAAPPAKGSKDSREAAADALKRLFNARR
jgi:pSer/pThr/pTyr-binding forkhead associated (FHA) protein